MSEAPSDLVLLDTSVLVHLIRFDATGQVIERQHALRRRPERPVLSSVVEGEILSLARGWHWGASKVDGLRAQLRELVRMDAGLPQVVEAYVELYCEATRTGKPKGENDLWIAATAKAAGATLVTCDRHFLWLDPDHLKVLYIPEDA